MSKAPSTAELVKDYVQRLENLESERAGLAQDMKDVLDEAAGRGLSKKALKEVMRLRKLDKSERDALLTDVDLYMQALGMLADTPLGEAAMKRAQAEGEVRPSTSNRRPERAEDVIDLEALPAPTTKAIEGPRGSAPKRLNGPQHRLPAPPVAPAH